MVVASEMNKILQELLQFDFYGNCKEFKLRPLLY